MAAISNIMLVSYSFDANILRQLACPCMKLKALIYLEASFEVKARNLAEKLSLDCIYGSFVSKSKKALGTFIHSRCTSANADFALVLDHDGLALHAIDEKTGTTSIRADFHRGTATYRRKKGGGKKQMIARAVGIQGKFYPHILDATAGLGKDAFVLASIGCQVNLLERIPVIYALLKDAMERAQQFSESEDADLLGILHRMHLINADARDYLKRTSKKNHPEVVYLDPMFPPRAKSAQVKKEMQIFHRLLGADESAKELLDTALVAASHRVVVKRPKIAEPLSGLEPSYQLVGKRNRYDIYLTGKSKD